MPLWGQRLPPGLLASGLQLSWSSYGKHNGARRGGLVRRGDDQALVESWGHKRYFKPGRESKDKTHHRNLRVVCAQSPCRTALEGSVLKVFSRTDCQLFTMLYSFTHKSP